MYKEGLFGWT